LSLRDGSVADICDNKLADAFKFESKATYQDALDNKIPCGFIKLDRVDEESVARLIAFWQYVAVYSSWLRDVDPFDQPQVEQSKELAFDMRKNS